MSVTLRDFAAWLEGVIPLEYQESYDNSGLQVGDPETIITSVLLTLDVTPEVIVEAEKKNCNLVLSHHPLIFNPLKRIAGNSLSEKAVAEAIRRKIAVYSTHTCFDAMAWGVSRIMAEMAGLKNIKVLVPARCKLFKLAVFVPVTHAAIVRDALFSAGAGNTGNYSSCSFSSPGEGSFMAGEGAAPYVGEVNKLHKESEVRIETIVPSHHVRKVIMAMKSVHPYEEVAYDLYALENEYEGAGTGAIGTLPETITGHVLLGELKKTFGTPVIRYSGNPDHQINSIAVCGGSGAGFINAASRAGADAFITGDIKYHSFVEAPSAILVADIGHYESEKFSLKVLFDLIIKKFPKFALRFSEVKTNPINYF